MPNNKCTIVKYEYSALFKKFRQKTIVYLRFDTVNIVARRVLPGQWSLQELQAYYGISIYLSDLPNKRPGSIYLAGEGLADMERPGWLEGKENGKKSK